MTDRTVVKIPDGANLRNVVAAKKWLMENGHTLAYRRLVSNDDDYSFFSFTDENLAFEFKMRFG
jgi:hypothetical protein